MSVLYKRLALMGAVHCLWQWVQMQAQINRRRHLHATATHVLFFPL
jgi:hypothetical protein